MFACAFGYTGIGGVLSVWSDSLLARYTMGKCLAFQFVSRSCRTGYNGPVSVGVPALATVL